MSLSIATKKAILTLIAMDNKLATFWRKRCKKIIQQRSDNPIGLAITKGMEEIILTHWQILFTQSLPKTVSKGERYEFYLKKNENPMPIAKEIKISSMGFILLLLYATEHNLHYPTVLNTYIESTEKSRTEFRQSVIRDIVLGHTKQQPASPEVIKFVNILIELED